MKRLFQLLFLSISLLSLSCTDPTEPVDSTRLKISLIDASVHETYLKLEVSDPSPDELILLQRNGSTVISYHSISDTIITDAGLNENTDYSYRIVVRKDGENASQSNKVKVRTLLPTSHEITWREFKIGNGDTRSDFWDILVRNENDIWACGEIYIKDSKGNESLYGCAHWDGLEWKYYKAMMHPYPTYPLDQEPVFSILEVNNILFGLSYAGTLRFGEYGWSEVTQFTLIGNFSYTDQMEKMWAKDEYSLYCGGGSGSVYLVNGGTWKKIRGDKEPFQCTIKDIWGVTDPTSGNTIIYCAYSDMYYQQKGKILKITDGDKFSEIPVQNAFDIRTVWTNKGYPIFSAGLNSFYENSTGCWNSINFSNEDFLVARIRGSALNNIFAVGGQGLLAHYNGNDWQIKRTGSNNVFYCGLHIKDNVVAVSGTDGRQGVILVGTR